MRASLSVVLHESMRTLALAFLLCVCIALALVACASAPKLADQSPVESDIASDVVSDPPAAQSESAALDAELLHDLLLARIALQRGQHRVALDALSRAATHSRDRAVIAEAIELALQLRDHQLVVELSALLPDSQLGFDDRIALAAAQFELDRNAQAIATLIDLARAHEPDASDADDESDALQRIAALLVDYAPEDAPQRMLVRFRQAAATVQPPSPKVTLTAAILARELGADDESGALIDAALRQSRGWQAAAMMKVTHLDRIDAPRATQHAARYADAFLRAHPTALRFRVHHARLLLQAGRAEDAATHLDIALQQNSKSSRALFVRALTHIALQQPRDALRKLHQSLALDPRNDRARLRIADIEIEREQFDAALAVLRGVSSAQYAFDAQIASARAIARRDGIDAGIRHLGRLGARDAHDATRIALARSALYREFDLSERAMQVLDRALEAMPQQTNLLYSRGILAAELNRIELHERDMRALIELQPDNADAYNALGYTLADSNLRLDEALALITTALELSPRSGHILDSMGWVHFRRGDTELAIDYLQRALEAQRDATIAAHLGEALWASGQRRAARAIWKRALEWESDIDVLRETIDRIETEAESSSANADELETKLPTPAMPRG